MVVGDTHGQFHDVCHMMDLVQMMPGGPAAAETQFVFNGDFVDRGSWGLEIVLLLAALKVSRPAAVYLVRGNHESSTCTKFYGFQGEVRAKYVGSGATAIYAGCKKLFAALPLAALVGGVTLVLHGGLFRHVPPPKKALGGAGAAVGGTKRKRRAPGGRGTYTALQV